MEFFFTYPLWAGVALFILLAFFVLILLFVSRKSDEPTAEEAFVVNPVQAQGKNIYIRLEDKVANPTTETFFIKLQFDLWSKYKVTVINVDLQYAVPAMPVEKKIAFDGKADDKYEPLDGSLRFVNRKEIAENSLVNVFASQQFMANYSTTKDYDIVNVDIEFLGEKWHGIRVLKITGQLSTQGKLINVKADIVNETLRTHN